MRQSKVGRVTCRLGMQVVRPVCILLGQAPPLLLGAGWQRHRRLSHQQQQQQRAAGSSHAALWEEHLSQMKPAQMKPTHPSAAAGAGAAGGRSSISRGLQAPLGHLAHAHGAGLRGGAQHCIHLQVGSQPAKLVAVLTVGAIKARVHVRGIGSESWRAPGRPAAVAAALLLLADPSTTAAQ